MTHTLDRRRFVKGMAGLGAGLAVGRVTAQKTATRPNILLIVAEDMGPTLSCYGDPQVRTPHLDRLAAQGVRFERAFVTQASCSPSRSSILTGLYPHQNGQLGLSHYGFRMPDGLPNLPSELKKAGYRTGIVGKLHVNPAKDFPFDFKGVGHSKTRDVSQPAASFRQFLQDGGAKPFFFYLNFADAHTPFSAQVAGIPKHPTKPDDVKPWDFLGIDSPELRQRVAGYYNSVRRVDEGIGRLMKVLDESGCGANTLVIFIGDHGPAFCRAKTTNYEAGVRIPMLVRWPGTVVAGAVRAPLVSTIDLLPTILAAAGAVLPERLPGRQLQPLLARADAPWRTTLCTENTNHGPTRSDLRRTIRDERYKLILNLLGGKRKGPFGAVDGCPAAKQSLTDVCKDPVVRQAYDMFRKCVPVELYDLENDPCELRNLADKPEMKTVRARLLKQLAQWREDTNDPTRTPEGLAALTKFQDNATASIKKRIQKARKQAKDEKRKLSRRDLHKCSQIKPTYAVPPR